MSASIAQPAPATAPLRLLTIATFCSGGCALLLEQIYEKYLSTLLGASRPAATIVLATFFLGLAIGGFFCPKRKAGARRRLAGLELFIAAWAVLVGVAFFPSCDFAAEWLAAASDGGRATLAAMRFALAVIWILPPTIAMGAQLPTLTAVLESFAARTPRQLTRLYTVNLLGGLAFTFVAPAILFNFLGADGALWSTAALSAVVGAMLWIALPRDPAPTGDARAATPEPPERLRRGEITLAAASGFVFFALEVLWFHLISAVCGASTYTFSLLLAAILLSLALAGRQVSRLAEDRSAGDLLLFVLSRLLPLLAIAAAAWPHLGRLFSVAQTRLRLETFWAGESLKFAVIAFAIVPPAIGLGMVFPLVLRGLDRDGAPSSRRMGWICTANVTGCVAGALWAGFVMIPWLGAEHSFAVLWWLVAGAAGLQAWRLRPRQTVLRPAALWAAAGLLALAVLPRWNRLELTRGFGVYFSDSVPPGGKLVFFDEDEHAGFVTVVKSDGPHRDEPTYTLFQNGKFDADNRTQRPAQIGLGAIGAMHAPRFDRALVIGCGSGHTASVIGQFGFDHVEVVDLSPGHFRAAREWFADLNRGILDAPGVTVAVEDGRNWLLRSRTRYDLIQIEITSIWFAGATNLYSREFYALAHRRLASGGVLMQWIQLHHLTGREIGCIVATVRETFPHVSLWRVGPQACILASMEPTRWNPAAAARWLSPEFAAEREATGWHTAAQIRTAELVPETRIEALLDRTSRRINTDLNRWLEFQTPKYYLSRNDDLGANLRLLREAGRGAAAAAARD